jgi:Mce-associated membrane protein
VTVVVEETPIAAVVPESPRNSLAPWQIRARAFVVDVLPGMAVATTMALVASTVVAHPVWWWVCASVGGLAILLTLINRLLLPTTLGWSLGRALHRIVVVRANGTAIGAWGLLLRELAHLLDTASVMMGWLWPLWDPRRRTFADILLRTEVRRDETAESPRDIGRWTAAAVAAATVLCLGGAAVSYTVVYSRDRATDQTIAQIQTEGPKIVAQMLTYDPKSLHDDFARARSLATDKYRGQLAAQQEVVEKGHPAINEYWPADGAIKAASPDRATMLLFMHGRRGAAPDERYISATVRVSFAKGGDNRWRVDDLTVVTKPKPPGNGK